MLKGAELLAKAKELEGSTKTQLARGCGYVTANPDGSERVNFTAFYAALLDAKGLTFSTTTTGAGRRGRGLAHKVKVQFNGKLMIGDGYLKLMGAEPGDEFEIRVGRKQITLVAANES
jgi:hypothetical protein